MEGTVRKRTSHRASSLGLVFGMLALAGCSEHGPQAPEATSPAPLPPALSPGSVLIQNDPVVLEQRLVRESRPLLVAALGGAGPSEVTPAKSIDPGAQLQLVGSVQPPVVDGRIVQANDVDVRDQIAVVAYNFAGDVFAGAIQVIDFRQPQHPVIVSEVLYRNADVNAVALQGGHVYVGLAADDPTLATPAVLQDMSFTPSGGLEPTGAWVDLPSWSVTDLAAEGDLVVAAVGARDGGLVLMRQSAALEPVGFVPAADVRGISLDGDVVLSVNGGETSLQRYALPSFDLVGGTTVDGFRMPAAKGTIETYLHRSYLGALEGGMQVRGSDGALLAQVPNDQFGILGSRPAIVNAVTVSSHLAFVAAGPRGVQVVELGRYRADDVGISADDLGLRVLGQLSLEDGASCNMAKAKDDVLVVAAGLGGVKLVEMHFDP